MLKLILRRKAFWIGILGILLLVVLVLRSYREPVASTPLAEPSHNPFVEDAIAAQGIIESVGENTRLAPAVSGLVKKIGVEAGDRVKKDQVLLELDDRNLRGQLLVQEAQLAKWKIRLQKVESLRDSEALSREERDNLRSDLRIASAEVERLHLLLDQLRITAPEEGVVLQVNTRVGESVAAPVNAGDNYVPPIVFGQGEGLQVRADVDEVNAHLIRPGSEARAFLKGRGAGEGIPLEFLRIEPYIIPKRSLSGDNTERVDTRVLQVVFRMKKTPQAVYVGQQLDVYIRRGPAQ